MRKCSEMHVELAVVGQPLALTLLRTSCQGRSAMRSAAKSSVWRGRDAATVTGGDNNLTNAP